MSKDLPTNLPLPLRLALLIDRSHIEQSLRSAVNRLLVDRLEVIRLAIAKEYYDGLRTKRWSAKNEFAELMFPDAVSQNARRCLIDRLMNNSYTGPGSLVTAESITHVGQELGLPVSESLDQATSMNAKRDTTVTLVLPGACATWTRHIGGPPAFPDGNLAKLSGRFVRMLSSVGMPNPAYYSDHKQFNNLVDSIEQWAPDSTLCERFWTAIWSMFRCPFSGFGLRLRHECYKAQRRNDPNGEKLLHHIETKERVLRQIRNAGRKLKWPNTSPKKVIELAQKRLSRERNVLSVDGLETFLFQHRATVHAICDQQVGIGWFIWNDENSRLLADNLLKS